MSSNSFFSIPPAKLIKLYPEIIKNSDLQYQTAIEIADNGKPGIAIPHLLISTEELIKALVVVLDAKGFKFRSIPGMEVFFKNHEIRFFLSSIIFVFTIFGDDFKKFMGENRSDFTRAKGLLNGYKNNEPDTINSIKRYLLRKFIIIREEIKWFSQAEIFRQNGFYVDMKGNLISPLNISQNQFEEAKRRINRVNKAIKYIIEIAVSKDQAMKEEVKRLIIQFDEKKYYDMISKELNNMRKGRKSFFEAFYSKFFKDLSDREKRKQDKKFFELMEKTRKRLKSTTASEHNSNIK